VGPCDSEVLDACSAITKKKNEAIQDKSHEISGSLPSTCRVVVATGDVLLLDTEHRYNPTSLPVTLSTWTYMAATAFITRELLILLLLTGTALLSLVQETVVAGPPVEVQVRVNTGGSVVDCVSNWKLISPGIVTWPPDRVKQVTTQMRYSITMVTVKYYVTSIASRPTQA